MRNTATALIVSISLSGCATRSKDVKPTCFPSSIHQSYDCDQVGAELTQVTHRVNEVAGQQDKTTTRDAWATGVGVVLFCPFFLC